jgi:hypothetical protein
MANGQGKYGQTWLVGEATSTLSQERNSNGKVEYSMNAPLPYPPFVGYRRLGNSRNSICDSATGELLFITDGRFIYNANLGLLDNSDSLTSSLAYTYSGQMDNRQGVMILPKGNKKFDIFFPFVNDSLLNGFRYADLLLHHVVDMNANNGAGAVVKKREEILKGKAHLSLLNMDAVRHANGIDWWIMKLGWGMGDYFDSVYLYTFLVKQDTIEGPFAYYCGAKFNTLQACGLNGRMADLKFSMDGTKFAGIHGCHSFYYGDFNRCTGTISNLLINNQVPYDTSYYIWGDTTTYYDSSLYVTGCTGIQFSPNNKLIYISSEMGVVQYEVAEPDSSKAWITINRRGDTVNQYSYQKGALRYGLDSTLFVFRVLGGDNYGYLNGIEKPDVKGKDCKFKVKKLVYNDTLNTGWMLFDTPPNHPNWALGADESLCWPLGNHQLTITNEQFTMHPNPANTQVLIDVGIAKKQQLQITNTNGQVVHQQELRNAQTSIDVSRWVRGVYFVKYNGVVRKMVVE